MSYAPSAPPAAASRGAYTPHDCGPLKPEAVGEGVLERPSARHTSPTALIACSSYNYMDKVVGCGGVCGVESSLARAFKSGTRIMDTDGAVEDTAPKPLPPPNPLHSGFL